MPIYARKQKKFSPAPEGLWPGVCIDVVDKGIMETQWGPKPKVQFRWLIDAQPKRSDGKPHMISKKYTNSLHEKANLRQMLEVWRGRKFTSEELDEFDLETVLGAQCQIQVAHDQGEDGPYAYPQVVMRASNGAKRMTVPPDYVRECNRPNKETGEYSETEEDFTQEVAPQIADDDIPF